MASTNLFPCCSTQNAKHNEPKKKLIELFLIFKPQKIPIFGFQKIGAVKKSRFW
jgi:hypothetical protein